VIFQLIDDHSRYALASHVAWGETSEAAIAVFDEAVTAHGVPQRLLSDNGIALNPSRRGLLGQLVVHVMALGVEPITGKPYKPTTQGKNERFHQTLFRYLDKQPLTETLDALQAQIDTVDHIYNTQRPTKACQAASHLYAEPKPGIPQVRRPPGRPPRRPRRHAPPATSSAVPPASPDPPRRRYSSTCPTTPSSRADQRRRVLPRQGPVPGRRPVQLPAGPRHHQRQQHRRHDHSHQPRRRDPHRAHPTRTRHRLRRQRQTTRTTQRRPQTVTEVLRHQLSPMS